MRGAAWVVAAGAALVVARVVSAEDPKDVRQLIDRALEAAGGADRLAQPRAYTFKQEMTAKTKKDPAGVVTRTTYYFQPPKKFRLEEESQRGGGRRSTSRSLTAPGGGRSGTACPRHSTRKASPTP
jgi:hypothetical protein